MAELPLVSPGEIIASDHINDIMLRAVMRYATIADRTAENPTPINGELAWMDAEGPNPARLAVFDGSAWQGVGEDVYLRLGGGTMTGDLEMNAFFVSAAGTVALPGITIVDSGTGIYRHTPGEIGFTSGGTEGLRFTFERFRAMAVVNDGTTANPANMAISVSDGRIRVSTSAAKYKDDIRDAPELAGLELRPVTYTSPNDDGDGFIGLVADDVAAQDDRLGLYRDGEINDFDLRGVVAVLAAKVNALEAQLANT